MARSRSTAAASKNPDANLVPAEPNDGGHHGDEYERGITEAALKFGDTEPKVPTEQELQRSGYAAEPAQVVIKRQQAIQARWRQLKHEPAHHAAATTTPTVVRTTVVEGPAHFEQNRIEIDAPARALIHLTVSDATERREIQPGDIIERRFVTPDLQEGIHFTRGSMQGDRPKAVTFAGKAAKTAKTFIMGYDPKDQDKPPAERSRHEFQPGEIIPMEQIELDPALLEGVHYE